MSNKTTITIEVKIDAPVNTVWKCWTSPEDITNWNFATDGWCCPKASNDLRSGGGFNYRMEAKDGSFGFDFYGSYEKVVQHKLIEGTMGDGRKLKVEFNALSNQTIVTEHFEVEDQNSLELQRNGWLAILNNFKKYVESKV